MSIAISKPRRKPSQKRPKRAPAAVPEFPVARMTVPEYLSLLERGIYEDRHVELWEGWVVERMPHGPLPVTLILLISEWLLERRPKAAAVRPQAPVQLRASCPEPDIAVVRGVTTDFRERLPVASEILLLVEVSDSTLKDDRRIKARMYAGANVPEYWIVNCEEEQVEVYTNPHATAKMPNYRKLTTYLPGQTIPVQIAGKKLGDLAVSDLFPAKK
jgi:Uma2 family endonuclease